MPAEVVTEVAQLQELLAKAASGALDANGHLSAIVEATENPDGETLSLHESRALLGQAFIVRTNVEWALEEADKVLRELRQQVWFAEEAEEAVAIEGGRDDAR